MFDKVIYNDSVSLISGVLSNYSLSNYYDSVSMVSRLLISFTFVMSIHYLLYLLFKLEFNF
jgi:hypothetical protein